MKKVSLFVLLAALASLVALTAVPAFAAETVTPDEIVAKCKEASAYLLRKGRRGGCRIQRPEQHPLGLEGYLRVRL